MSNLILDFFNFVISIVMVFFTILIFRPINKYKNLKSKEEQLFLQKTLLTTIIFTSVLLEYILYIFWESKILYYIELFLFNSYIIAIVLYNFFMAFELYSTFTNPVHYFNRLFKQQKFNYIPEIIILIICLLVILFDSIFYKTNFYNIDIKFGEERKYALFYCDDSTIFVIIGNWKSFMIIILCIASLWLYYSNNKQIHKFCFKNQEKLYNLIIKRSTSIYLYLIYALFYILPVLSNVKMTIIYNCFGSIFFMIIIIIDFCIHISIISTTKFCEYRLKRTILQYFCSWFYKPWKHNNSSNPLVSESNENEALGLTTFQNDTTTALEMITGNPNDKELISIFKNGIFIEDYFLSYFDQILNILTISIYQTYISKYFSSQANDIRISNTFQIGGDMSSIGGTMQNLTVSNLGGNNNKTLFSASEVGDDIARFDINKNMEVDDLIKFKEVLENGLNINQNNNFLKINIKSFFTPRCVESIYERRLKGKNIANSLLSHMILTNIAKNRNRDNPNSYYWSLLASNGKEGNFRKLNNTSIKTYDKNFTLDIFDTNDEEITYIEKGNNSKLSTFIDKYFTYIHGKGKATFMPSLVGVFKVKINNFKTLLVLITRNSLVENDPKDFFTYWQLIRFFKNKPEKITSSQFNAGTLVKDDNIFERAFQIETRKDNPNYNKISFKNYIDFEETIQSDIEFLSQCGAQNFDLLLMYYEYENMLKHEKQGAIKIKKNATGGTEIVEESLPKDDIFDEVGSPIDKIADSPGGGILGDFLDDNEFNKNLNINPNKNIGKFIDVDEAMNITGYEGIFDSYTCLCYFTFENVFDIKKRTSSKNYYDNFKKSILINFTEYKPK